jgi:hypothetical protein
MNHVAEIIRVATRQITWHRDLIRAQERIVHLAWQLITPSEMTVTLISERSTPLMDFLKYRAVLPALPVGTDTVSQLFDVSANGEGQPTQTLGRDVASVEFEVPQGVNVDLKLTYADDAGNLSQPRLQSFVATDTIAPEAPGDFGAIELIGERHEDDPAPTE